MIRYARAAAALTAATLAGIAIGVTLTVYLSGWTGTVSVLTAPTVPAWVSTAETASIAAAVAAGAFALAWMGLDYTHADE